MGQRKTCAYIILILQYLLDALKNIEKITSIIQNSNTEVISIKECSLYISNIINIPVGLPLDNIIFHNLNI